MHRRWGRPPTPRTAAFPPDGKCSAMNSESQDTQAFRTSGLLRRYIEQTPPGLLDAGAAAFFAQLESVGAIAPAVAQSIVQELVDQRANIKLIASENYCSLAVQQAHGNLLTDKYAE